MRSAPLLALMDAARPPRREVGPVAALNGQPLRGRHVAILCAQPAHLLEDFGQAVVDLGAKVALLNAPSWLHSAERAEGGLTEAAHLLGRLYDLVDVCDLDAATVDQIEQHAHIPVFDGLARADHEFHLLAELMTMRELAKRPFQQLSLRLAGESDHRLHEAANQAARQLQMTLVREPVAADGEPLPPDLAAASFVLDATAPIDAGRLAFEHAPAVDAGRWLNDVARNRRLLLQAAVQAVLRTSSL